MIITWIKGLSVFGKVVLVLVLVTLAAAVSAGGWFADSAFLGAGPNGPSGLSGPTAQAAGDPTATHKAPKIKITARPVPTASSPAAEPTENSPMSLVSGYYTLINGGNYSEAWPYLSPAVQDQLGPYSSWAAGYAGSDTTLTQLSASGDTVTADLVVGGDEYQGTWTVNSNASLITSAHIVQASPAASPSSSGGALVSGGAPGYVGFSNDATNIFTATSWSNWGGATATATGTVNYLNCVPDCAGSTIHQPYPATVTFSGLSGGAYTSVTEHILAGPMSGMQPGYPAPGDPNNESIITPTWPYLSRTS